MYLVVWMAPKVSSQTHLCLSCLLSGTFVTGNPIDLKLLSDSSHSRSMAKFINIDALNNT